MRAVASANATSPIVQLAATQAQQPPQGAQWSQGERPQRLEVGGWLSARTTSPRGREGLIERDRVGKRTGSALFGTSTAYANDRAYRLLDTEQLWLVYLRSPEVRSAIDSIVRRVATWDWEVMPTLEPDDTGYEAALEAARGAQRFLSGPNFDGETWQELVTKLVTDLLVYDAGVMEMVFADEVLQDPVTGEVVVSRTDTLEEIVTLRGGDIRPIGDIHNRVLGYEQELYGSGAAITGATSELQVERLAEENRRGNPVFLPEQIVYLRLYANTSSLEGAPIIETILNEIATLLKASEHALLTFDADEIPPGILVLTGLAGQAAAAAKADLQRVRSKDHKIRVVTSADPQATGAKWVELRRSFKDVDFQKVVETIRRVVWRAFGVMPVEMGATEDIPRAVGQVQLEVGSSHLINPILEILEAKMNLRVLPLVLAMLGTPDAPVALRFDRDAKLTPSQRLDLAKAATELIQNGVLKRNEARKELGYTPETGGDVLTVEVSGQGPVPLTTQVSANGTDDDTDPEGGTDPSATAPQEGEDAPGEAARPAPTARALARALRAAAVAVGEPLEVVRRRLLDRAAAVRARAERRDAADPDTRSPTCRMDEESVDDFVARKVPELLEENPDWDQDQAVAVAFSMYETACGEEQARAWEGRHRADLPSAWQARSRFDGLRTVDLTLLWEVTAAYQRAVEPLYSTADDEIVAAVRALYRPQQLDTSTADLLRARIDAALDKLAVAWSAATASHYREAASIGRDLAADLTGLQVLSDWEDRGRAFADEALGHLSADGGLVASLRTALGRVVDDLQLQADDLSAARSLGPATSVEVASLTVASVLSSQRHRIANWSGRLVQLANATATAGLQEGGPGLWHAEWVSGSARGCPTCSHLAGQGFLPVSELSTVPGGDTECGARCRCVLVYWTGEEIERGEARRLNPAQE